jgi:hypothetical protein
MTTAEDAIRARRRPVAILGVWAWQTALAWFASWPAASLVQAAYGSDPRGDGVLWMPGSHALLDFLWREAHGVSAALRGAAYVLLVGAVAGLVPLAALMVAMAAAGAAPGGRRGHGIAETLRVLPAMTLLLFVMTAGQALALGAGAFAGQLAEGWTLTGLGEARAQQLGLALGVPFLVLAVAIGVTHDLARAALVRGASGGMRALALGVAEFGAAPMSLAWSWAWRAAGGLVPVIVVGAVAGRLGARGGAALLLLALLHQGVVLGRVALRASWLAAALRRMPGDAHWRCAETDPYFDPSTR